MKYSVRKYHKKDCITFKSTKGEYGALSNMAPNFPININNVNIKNSELLYQALRFPDYPEIQQQILLFDSPISAKKYGRTHLDKTRDDWKLVRFKIMKFCIEAKLYNNWHNFSKVLLSTKNLTIVEYTTKDKVWGATREGDYYEGTNALGRLLMELREKVVFDNFEIDIPRIENLKLLGESINEKSMLKKSS
jgi:ribA/ribD-fused uncharacterized protein